MKRRFIVILTCVIIIAPLVTPINAEEPIKQQLLVDQARITFKSFMIDKNMAWFREHMHKAKGFLIIPELLQGAWFIGGSGGRGVLVVKDKKTGDWSQPAFYTIGSLSFGIQFGGEKSEIIMVVFSQKGLDRLYSSSFKFGGDASIAVGPVGGGAKADVMTDFVSFMRSKGAFAGISLEGAIVKANYDWNEAYYGKKVSPLGIVEKKLVSNPGSAELLNTVQSSVK
ncbi:MAG: lipid-binding SYLF domain-containing protein [Deltaproteobacteria bacterium]|jgi:lipid-binding SYLF domain-containing protein|nr:lipid-binding SYLF domain-containing protein [Deltaproteobacteria bacterium]